MVRDYEKMPRKMARTEEKEVIHLLPIKDKTGLIPQSVERGSSLPHATFNQSKEEEKQLRVGGSRTPRLLLIPDLLLSHVALQSFSSSKRRKKRKKKKED